MKHLSSFLVAIALSIPLSNAENLLQIPDPRFESSALPGMAIHQSPEAKNALSVKVVNEGAMEGAGCLEISMPVAAYASVSFPLRRTSNTAALKIACKGDLGAGSDVKIGLQSYNMNPDFQNVDFKPFFGSSQITPSWQVHKQTIQRAEGATHWQVSIGIKGPATVWIDGLEVQGQ